MTHHAGYLGAAHRSATRSPASGVTIDATTQSRNYEVYGEIEALGARLAEAKASIGTRIIGQTEVVDLAPDAGGGEVVEVNEALADEPEIINNSPYDNGWLFKVKPSGDELDEMMDADAYQASIED